MGIFYIQSIKYFIMLLLPILFVLGSVRLLVTDAYLAFEYSKSSFPADPFGFDRVQRLDYASANFLYVRENQAASALADQRLGDQPLYNNRELKHMQDVQDVYQAAWRVWQISFALVSVSILFLLWRRETWPDLGKALLTGGLFTAGLIALVGLLAVVAWQIWFVAFHQVFFAPGTWTFYASDALIRLFPEKFWFDAALSISGLSVVGGFASAMAGRKLMK